MVGGLLFVPGTVVAADVVTDSCLCSITYYGTSDPNDPADSSKHCHNFNRRAIDKKNIPIVNAPTTIQDLYQLVGASDIIQSQAQQAGCLPFLRRIEPPGINVLAGRKITVTRDNCTALNAADNVTYGDNNHFYIVGFTGCQLAKKQVREEDLDKFEKPLENVQGDATAELKKLGGGLSLLKVKSVPEFIGLGLKIAMGIVGSIALVVLIYAGIVWMTSTGNANREKHAMDIMTWGALGLIVVLSSYAIVQFFFDSVL